MKKFYAVLAYADDTFQVARLFSQKERTKFMKWVNEELVGTGDPKLEEINPAQTSVLYSVYLGERDYKSLEPDFAGEIYIGKGA